MASGIFAILDDIAALMDDVALASKIATQKTAGILGDDLAVNAEKATGFLSSREIPVLWAITKGSFLNKLIIVPIAIILNIFFPEVLKYILILGGFYLAYEGVEKIIEWIFHSKKEEHEVVEQIQEDDGEESEKSKVKSAVSTDFILSLEIVIIALGSVIGKPLPIQIATVCIVAVLATVGVYGIVMLIVRMDDAGYFLIKKSHNKGWMTQLGKVMVKTLPIVIRILGVVGTIALILVSGGIFSHNIEYLHHLQLNVPSIVKETLFGLTAGIIMVVIVTAFSKTIKVFRK
jgi:predicted DNA repair protein MutK